MIALVDHDRKGYVTEQEFLSFFNDKSYVDEEQLPPLPIQMENKKKWV